MYKHFCFWHLLDISQIRNMTCNKLSKHRSERHPKHWSILWLVFEGKKITPIIDFTGAKNLSLYDADAFVVTTTQPDEYIKSFSICMRPIELNIMFESHRNSTNYIYLTHIKHINKKRRASVRARLLMHMYGDIMSSFRVIIELALSRIWKR